MKRKERRFFIMLLLAVSCLSAGTVHAKGEKAASVTYRSHIQTYGWQAWRQDGQLSGTTGQSKRLEAVEMRLNSSYSGNIQYRTHVQSYGWQNWKTNGQISGTFGEAKRLEAIEIRLVGEIANHYDVCYRGYVQSYGWLGWAKNGQSAGTAGMSRRLEAIEIQLVPKSTPLPDDGKRPYMTTDLLQYSVHVQSYGWQPEVSSGQTAGTVGKAKRLEAIQISLDENNKMSGGITYRTHVQSYGWMDWAEEGEISGTSGESKRLEAIQIKLTGEMAGYYDIYYRVHAQSYGWLGWAKNGQPAGTAGYSKRLEAIEIVLKKKAAAAPGSTADYYRFKSLQNLMDITEGIGDGSQIITVVGDGTRTGATLDFWQKQESGWGQKIHADAILGRNGLSDHTFEGDKTTPIGCYDLGIAFGNKPNPGTSLPWVDVNPYHYWIDDLGSAYYNQLIDSRQVPEGWRSGEHLSDYVPHYNYSVNIEVNPQCRKDSTSAIFLHCSGGALYTSGCVGIGEWEMKTALQLLKPGARIVIVRNKEDLLRYMEY